MARPLREELFLRLPLPGCLTQLGLILPPQTQQASSIRNSGTYILETIEEICSSFCPTKIWMKKIKFTQSMFYIHFLRFLINKSENGEQA